MTKTIFDIEKTHYGMSMNPEYMANWASIIAKKIESAMDNENRLPILVYRGMSGVATATAISLMLSPEHRSRIGMLYVRKKKEKSHGSYVEFNSFPATDTRIPLWIICDDFISRGNTVLEILKVISVYFGLEIGPDTVRYALTLTHTYEDEASKLNVLDECIFHPNALKVCKSIRRRYAQFWKKELKRIADCKAKQAVAIDELLGLPKFKIASTVRIPSTSEELLKQIG